MLVTITGELKNSHLVSNRIRIHSVKGWGNWDIESRAVFCSLPPSPCFCSSQNVFMCLQKNNDLFNLVSLASLIVLDSVLGDVMALEARQRPL